MRSFEDRRAQVRITAAVLILLSVLSALIAMCLGAAQLPLALLHALLHQLLEALLRCHVHLFHFLFQESYLSFLPVFLFFPSSCSPPFSPSP